MFDSDDEEDEEEEENQEAVKQILRFNGCDFNGEYTEYVDKLVEIEWTPEQHQVDFYNNQSAKFIQSEERGVDLQCADLDYLANFEENELKQWAKQNIKNEQPTNESKDALMSLIYENYTLVLFGVMMIARTSIMKLESRLFFTFDDYRF